jgi:hypothetical protein
MGPYCFADFLIDSAEALEQFARSVSQADLLNYVNGTSP